MNLKGGYSFYFTLFLEMQVLRQLTGLTDFRAIMGDSDFPLSFLRFFSTTLFFYINNISQPQFPKFQNKIAAFIRQMNSFFYQHYYQQKMLNNYTDNGEYQCCSIIIPSNENRGALLVGDFNSATDYQIIKKYKIKTIITAALGMEHLKIPNTLTHIIYPLADAKSQNIRKYFDDCAKTIETNIGNGSILIHCAAGISRSATLAIAYLMKTRKMCFKDAIRIVRNKRKVICPNLGFERQLKKYETQILPESTEKAIYPFKKTISQKLVEEKSTFNKSGYFGRNIKIGKQTIKFQPKTAQQAVRRKAQYSRKLYPYNLSSQNRPRQRKIIKIKKPGQEELCVLGHTAKTKDLIEFSIKRSERLKPPIIQSYHKNLLRGSWGISQKK